MDCPRTQERTGNDAQGICKIPGTLKTIGRINYNIYCSLVNNGMMLQKWALCQAIERVEMFYQWGGAIVSAHENRANHHTV